MEKNNKLVLIGIIIFFVPALLASLLMYLNENVFANGWFFAFTIFIWIVARGGVVCGGYLAFYGLYNRISIRNEKLRRFLVFILSLISGVIVALLGSSIILLA